MQLLQHSAARAGSHYDFPLSKLLKSPLIPQLLAPEVVFGISQLLDKRRPKELNSMHTRYVIDKYVDPDYSDESINVNSVCSTRSVRDQDAREVKVDYHNGYSSDLQCGDSVRRRKLLRRSVNSFGN